MRGLEKATHMRQQELIPDEKVPVPSALVDQLDEYLGQEENLKAERDRLRDERDNLIAAMVFAGIERIPYTDAATGKRKYFVADRTARAKKISAAGSDGKAKRAREDDVEIAEVVETVESRRVRRTAKHDELADPFAATRGKMEP